LRLAGEHFAKVFMIPQEKKGRVAGKGK